MKTVDLRIYGTVEPAAIKAGDVIRFRDPDGVQWARVVHTEDNLIQVVLRRRRPKGATLIRYLDNEEPIW